MNAASAAITTASCICRSSFFPIDNHLNSQILFLAWLIKRQQFVDKLTRYVGESEVAALESVC